MFDLTSSKLLILGIVALLVVGPKELPVLLRTIGKYVGIVRRHAAEFRAQFDDAMREQELAGLKAEMEKVKADVETTVTAAGRSVEADMAAATREIDASMLDAPFAPGARLEPDMRRFGENPPVAEAAREMALSPAGVAQPEHRIHGPTPPVATEPAPKVGA